VMEVPRPSDRGDDCRFNVRASVDGDRLAVRFQANRAGDRDNGCKPALVASLSVVAPGVTHLSHDGVSRFRTRVDPDWLADLEVRHAGDFDIDCTRGRSGRQSGLRRGEEIGAVAVRLSWPSGRRPALVFDTPAVGTGGQTAAAQPVQSRNNRCAPLRRWPDNLRRPMVDEAAVVEAVDHKARASRSTMLPALREMVRPKKSAWQRERGPRTTDSAPASPDSPPW